MHKNLRQLLECGSPLPLLIPSVCFFLTPSRRPCTISVRQGNEAPTLPFGKPVLLKVLPQVPNIRASFWSAAVLCRFSVPCSLRLCAFAPLRFFPSAKTDFIKPGALPSSCAEIGSPSPPRCCGGERAGVRWLSCFLSSLCLLRPLRPFPSSRPCVP
jgi:hypothetical protein